MTITIPSLRTIIGATLRVVTRRNIVLGILLLMSYAFAYNAGRDAGHAYNGATSSNVVHACMPIDTGGGVTQCANPTTFDLAIVACFDNDSYVGANIEDTFHLMRQCVRDYLDMKGW